MLKKLIIVLLLIVITGLAFVYKIYNKPHVNVIEAEADLALNSQFLVDEFMTDESKANAKYLDQIIEVKGPIGDIIIEDKKIIISLGKRTLFGNVTCHLTVENNKEYYNLKIGQTVTLKGICTGYLMNVILVRSVLIN